MRMQWEMFDEVICCVCKNIKNTEMFTKDFLQHVYKIDFCNFRDILIFTDMITTKNAIKRNWDLLYK